MITKSNFILRQVYTAIATLVLMLMLVGGGLYILQTKRYDLELNVSHYHLSSIALASGAKERLLHAKEAIVGLDSFDSSAIGGLVYLVGKDLSNLQKIQEDFNSQEFVFILDTIDERFDDLSALVGKEDFPRDPFFKLTASLILEFDRLARLHQVGASESSAQIDQVENEIYPVLFAILFLSLSVGGWRLKLSIYRIKKMIAGSRKQEELTTRFGRILDNSSNEIYVFDASTLHFIQVNSGARENLGYSMDELTHMTPLSFKPEYTLETFEKLIEPLRSGKKSVIGFETV
ncbi:MAG: PAS domain S-box protein, partial [Nitrospina sp.]|nr:PAS domain S-box protein [Nitrospina sp.]